MFISFNRSGSCSMVRSPPATHRARETEPGQDSAEELEDKGGFFLGGMVMGYCATCFWIHPNIYSLSSLISLYPFNLSRTFH